MGYPCLLLVLALLLPSCAPEVGDVYTDRLTGGNAIVDGVGTCKRVAPPILVGNLMERSDAVVAEVEFQIANDGRRNWAMVHAPTSFDTIPSLARGDDRSECVAVLFAERGGAIYGRRAFEQRFKPAE